MSPSRKSHPSGGSVPVVSRPSVPPIYGIPESQDGLLDWSHVAKRMLDARIYWVTTVSLPDRPHATPVDGIGFEEALYFGGSPESKWHRNLARNSAVCIHLESGTDVVILHGDAENVVHPERSFTVFLEEESQKKYGYGPPLEAYDGGGLFSFQPRKVLAWSQFPTDATRFRFPDR